jgi:GNAT superfamily N-acetyltransferase
MKGLSVRLATVLDATLVSRLFEENGNPHNWNAARWMYYYFDYPEGAALSFIAILDNEVVGHYGLQKINIKDDNAFLGLHAYVKSSMRGVVVISKLLNTVDNYCKDNAVDYLIGFANKKFTTIKTALFKWKCILWLSFEKRKNYLLSDLTSKRFRLEPSDDWLEWRFNRIDNHYKSKYSNLNFPQLLKITKDYNGENIQCWHPTGNLLREDKNKFTQPFSIKVFNENFLDSGILEPDNWALEMGDSDTFIYNRIQ